MINTKQLLTLGIILLLSLTTKAQQSPHFTQYLYNLQVINPAYIGNRADLSIGAQSRFQWNGIQGAPTTYNIALNSRLKNGLGLGISASNDKIGLAKNTSVHIDASYSLPLSEKGLLSIGLKGTYSMFSNDLASGITPDGDSYTSLNDSYPNIGFGALFYNEKFYVGIAAPNLLEKPIFTIDQANTTSEVSDNTEVFFNAGIRFKLNEKIMAKPSTMVKYRSNLPLSIDINTSILYDNLIEGGISYRYNDSMSLLLAVIIDQKYRLGYSIDQTLTSLGNTFQTHEISLQIDLDMKRDSRWIYHSKCYF